MAVKFTDLDGKSTLMNKEEFMQYMHTLWEIGQLRKAEREKNMKEAQENG